MGRRDGKIRVAANPVVWKKGRRLGSYTAKTRRANCFVIHGLRYGSGSQREGEGRQNQSDFFHAVSFFDRSRWNRPGIRRPLNDATRKSGEWLGAPQNRRFVNSLFPTATEFARILHEW